MGIRSKQINRILIAGTHSGCGKTTVTCGILRALQKRSIDVKAFKCGPDYIDPMFHSEVIGAESRNIDMYLCSEEVAKSLFVKNNNAGSQSLAVVEGVMGYYDGLGGNTTTNSTHYIAQKLQIPTILVVDCKGASLSAVAMIQGYANYRENNIVGVILNRVSKMMLPFYREMIERETGIKVLGCMPRDNRATIGSRHLGLITAEEIQDLNEKIDVLSGLVEENIDLDEVIRIGQAASKLDYFEAPESNRVAEYSGLKIAVARDKAFCFYYQDGLESLEELGAELLYFSPLYDGKVPEGVDGIILGGGYPELYLGQLSRNQSMLESIRNANVRGVPIYGECGGFMYLGQSIDGYEMTGLIEMKSEMTERLQNFGYASLTAIEKDSLLEGKVHAHEFHYSKSDIGRFVFQAEKSTGKTWKGGYCSKNLWAQYAHIHFAGELEVAKRFLQKCYEYRNEK